MNLTDALKYIPDKQPVLVGGPILAGLLLGAIVAIASRIGITFSQDELVLLGIVCYIASGAIVKKFVTPVANPNLPVGTVVNATSSAPTSVVVPQASANVVVPLEDAAVVVPKDGP